MPFPGGSDDVLDFSVLNVPTEFFLCLGGIGVKRGGVAGAAFGFHYGNFQAGDFFNRGDDFADRVGGAGAEVVEIGGAGFVEFFKDLNVGTGKVVHVNVVAQAGAIGGRIIRAEDLDVFATSGGGVDHEGDEMSLGVVVFADRAVLRRSGGIEIAESRKAQSVGVRECLQAVLDVELGLPVGIDRCLREGLHHGQGLGFAVGRAGRGKDEFGNAVIEHGLEEAEGRDEVVLVVFAGFGDRFAHVGEGCEMHDQLDLFLAENFGNRFGIAEIAIVEGNGGMHGGSMPEDQVIEHYRFVTRSLQLTHAMATNVARSSYDENFHIDSMLCV